ncbi:RICIN domain-containing protein [Streptomyces sp. NPDC052727]|uniref:RICIN domain-containing protein n=1 Tax=unclassified Streptomyces TaxID=2593676 RepID=UPI00342C26E2
MRRIFALVAGLVAAISLTLVSGAPASADTTGYMEQTSSEGVGIRFCATPQGNGTSNGTIVTTWSCTGSSLQQWTYYGDGYLRNVASGKCLTPSGDASAVNGTVLTLWTCTNAPSQRFVLYQPSSGWDSIFTYYGGKCITNKGDVMAQGVYLTLWTCNPSKPDPQHWGLW